MSTENAPIVASQLSSAAPGLRLSRGAHGAMPRVNTPSQTDLMRSDDPRWVFAMRARLTLDRGIDSNDTIARLIEQGMSMGLNSMQIRAIIGIIEQANARGGFDLIAHDEIMRLPEAESDACNTLSDRARWITFGALFAWALLIAGLMQIIA